MNKKHKVVIVFLLFVCGILIEKVDGRERDTSEWADKKRCPHEICPRNIGLLVVNGFLMLLFIYLFADYFCRDEKGVLIS